MIHSVAHRTFISPFLPPGWRSAPGSASSSATARRRTAHDSRGGVGASSHCARQRAASPPACGGVGVIPHFLLSSYHARLVQVVSLRHHLTPPSGIPSKA